MEFHFEFVTELTTRAQADVVLDAIIKLVEQYGGSVGGGFRVENSDGEEESEPV